MGFSILVLPAFACIILVGIHVLFGVHVLKRGVLFVDLALAQWAAMGYLVAHSLHIEAPLAQFACVVAFPVVAALLLSLSRTKLPDTTRQEAFIGVLYISASAVSIMLVTTLGLDPHHFTETLTGHLLFVDLKEVVISAAIYIVIGLFLLMGHRVLSKRHIISDFLFYAAFAVVVTSSVKLAGVLLVFSLLVIPVLAASLISKSMEKQMVLAWVIGILACVFGIIIVQLIDIQFSIAIMISLIGLLIPILFRSKSA